MWDEKLSFWNKINLDGIKGYFHEQSHDKQFSERDVSKQSDDLGLFSGYIIEPKKQFQQDHSIRTSSSEYFDLGLNSSAIHIKQQVELKKEIDVIKNISLTNKDRTKIFCEIKKVIYVADKSFYKEKRKKKTQLSS